MASNPASPARGLRLMFAWRRVVLAACAAAVVGVILSPAFPNVPTPRMIAREAWIALGAVLAFGIFEQWPRRLPRWMARWALQVVFVAISVPITVLVLYKIGGDPVPFWKNQQRLTGFMLTTVSGLLVAPWIAVAALFRQREEAARTQALAFDLERSELERKALDARLRLLQSQVEPHFLFNTLANVRELVDSGSPQASAVLDNLIVYLRAAVPRLHDPATTVGQEMQLVRSYLELMHMRMPDRLQFTLQVDEAAAGLRCPPTTLLTLVENAIRHGIDPSEDGGRIEVRVRREGGRCVAEVRDTGVGLASSTAGAGTGLTSLRERLQLFFGGDAQLRISSIVPRGASAEVDFPATAAP